MAASAVLLSILDRERMIFQEQVAAVSSVNGTGPFDILPDHANFISLITDKIVIHKLDGTEQELPISQGILRVYKNQANVFLGVGGEEEVGSRKNAL